jgi:hypothetical protein
MLFMYMHTHAPEKCLVDEPDVAREVMSQLRKEAEKARVKMVGPYMANEDHTVFAVFDGDDYAAIQKVITPMATWGAARLIPISPVA